MTYHGSKTNIPIALVATKIDLLTAGHSSLDEASKIAQEKGWLFHKTSAKENIGINELFESLIRKFLNLPLLPQNQAVQGREASRRQVAGGRESGPQGEHCQAKVHPEQQTELCREPARLADQSSSVS